MHKSEREFLDLLRYDPDSVENLVQLGSLYSQEGRYAEAMKIYSRLIELRPEEGEYYNDVGVLLYSMGKDDDAEWMLKKSIELGYEYGDAHLNLARIHAKKRDTISAVKYFWEYLKHTPHDQEIQEEFLDFLKGSKLNRVLIVMEEGIGNMVMLTPTIRAIKSICPEMEIDVMGKYPALEIVEGWKEVRRTLTVPDTSYYAAVFYSMWSGLYRKLYGSVLAQHSCYQLDVSYQDAGEHEASNHLLMAKLFGFNGELPSPYCPSQQVDTSIEGGDSLIGICDTSLPLKAWERKRWPHYGALARALISKGYRVALFGGKAEAEKFNPDDWPQGILNFMGQYTLPQTAYLMKKCRAVIANDSGPAHMAGALGVRTIVLFGPTLTAKNLPLGPEVKSISSEIGCRPCQYTERWNECTKWDCMEGISVEKVLTFVTEGKNVVSDAVEIGSSSLEDLKLVSKDYSGCKLVEENHLKFLVKDSVKERLRIHLVGAGKSNFPWGMENEIRRALELEGIEFIETDYRTETEKLGRKLRQQAHLMLVCKGSGISPELIRLYPGRTLLWYQDDVFTAPHAARDLSFNGQAFDTVYSFDQSALDEYRRFGIRDVRHLLLAMSPALHRKMFVSKQYDVTFVGNIHPNRKAFLEGLRRRFNIYITKAFMDDMVRIFNQSRIVLNLGLGPTGIQQRVFESLGCGSFLLTNEIPSSDRIFEDRKHLAYFNERSVESLILHFLNHEEEREKIAYQGYLEAHAKHTFQNRISQLLEDTQIATECSSTVTVTSKVAKECEDEGRRRLLVFWHGIGDNIMAIPALRAFRESHPNDFIGYMYLRRIHKDGLMNGCPYVDTTYTCSDAWDDYPDYETGVREVIKEAREVALREGYDEVVPITLRAMPLTHHRIERIAYELGVELNNWSTEMWVSDAEKLEATEILTNWGIAKDDFIVAVHRRGANIHKYWEVDEAQKVVDYLKGYYNAKVIVFETHTDLNREPARQLGGVFSTADLNQLPLKVSAELIARCSVYIGLDSGPMWIATTTRTPVIALFTMTWMHQSAPLRANSMVVASDKAWQMAEDSFKRAHDDRLLHDSTGGTKISAETVLKAIRKLNLRPNRRRAQQEKVRGGPVEQPEPIHVYTPPATFQQPGAYWGAFLTLRCSAKCAFCIQKIVPHEFKQAREFYNGRELSAEEWIVLLNGIDHQHGQPLALIGGEPSLHPGFVKILNGLEGYAITVTTNLISRVFRDIDSFARRLRPKCSLRFNTSFHPGFIKPEDFACRIKDMKSHGLWVDQVAMVDNPGSDYGKYAQILKKLGIDLRPQTFLGINDGQLYPNKQDLTVTNNPREHGITDYALYEEGFRAKTRKVGMCKTRRFLIAPDGSVHNCHYHLYSAKGSIGDLVRGDVFLREQGYFCSDFGYCNPCDYPHVKFVVRDKANDPKCQILMPKDHRNIDHQICPICSKKLEQPVIKDMMFCSTCEIYKKRVIPSRGNLKGMMKKFGIGAMASEEKGEKRLNEARKQLKWVFQKIPHVGRLFDVGASGGFMMKVARDSGWQVEGNEISFTSVQYAKATFGLNITYGFLDELPLERESYDLVVFWHSLEHSQDLKKTMKTVHYIVKAEGYVAIAVPLKESNHELERSYEALHFYEFSETGLNKLMTIHGFEHVDSQIIVDPSRNRQIQAIYKKKPSSTKGLPAPLAAKKPSSGRLLVTGAGHSGTNWVTEIVRATGKYRFTEAVEDRAFFFHTDIPTRYATKLATDNVGMYWDNIRKKMVQYQDMMVVFSVRHPVDNAMSKMVRAMPMQGNERVQFLWELSWDGTLNGTVKSLENAYLIYRRLKDEYPDRHLLVKLEDLILNTTHITKNICQFVGVSYKEEYAEAYKNTRNRWQQLRYRGEKEMSQIEMYKRLDEVHGGFFKDKKCLVDFMKKHLTPIAHEFGYSVEVQ